MKSNEELKAEMEQVEAQMVESENSFIQFLNHSSIIIGSRKTRILCDPWFLGTAFADGWSLLNDRSHDINKLRFDYIWISHEHADHFSIPTLNMLRSKAIFLYQDTLDKKVKSYLDWGTQDQSNCP